MNKFNKGGIVSKNIDNNDTSDLSMVSPAKVYKQWLDNEYAQWIKALQESTVHNFKEHPVVKRMLGQPNGKFATKDVIEAVKSNTENIYIIDQIGCDALNYFGLDGRCERYIYYALEVLKRNPSSICEIGGGVGQFYAILRALGYKGSYWIFDLMEVQLFQHKYLAEVEKQTGLQLHLSRMSPEMVVSFYSLGEFDDKKKENYSDFINGVKSGYIAWNPHSGATDDLSLFKHDIKVTPGIEPGIKIIEW